MIFKGGLSCRTAYVPSVEGSSSNMAQMLLSLERMMMYDNNVRRHTFAFLWVLWDHSSFFLFSTSFSSSFFLVFFLLLFLEDVYTSLEEAYTAYNVAYASSRHRYNWGVPKWRTPLSRLRTQLERCVRIFGQLLMHKSFLTSHFRAFWTFLLFSTKFLNFLIFSIFLQIMSQLLDLGVLYQVLLPSTRLRHWVCSHWMRSLVPRNWYQGWLRGRRLLLYSSLGSTFLPLSILRW